MMKQNAQGFTLIELVVVIVILGILAAAALPKFIDLRGDAGTAAAKGAAGALNSASNVNYAASLARTATGTGVVRISGGEACSALAGSLTNALDTSAFAITGNSPAGCTSGGATFACTVTPTGAGASGSSTAATLICTG